MRSTERSTRKKLIGAVVALAFVAAACGSDACRQHERRRSDRNGGTRPDRNGGTRSRQSRPAPRPRLTATPAEVEEPGVPRRVISLSPTHTEIMFAIGAGDLLVAVDDFSNFPAEALELPNELSGFEPNVEAIAAFEPDLVLIGGDFSGLGDQLAASASHRGTARPLRRSTTLMPRSNSSVRPPATSLAPLNSCLTCRPVSPQRSLQHRRPKLR